MTAPILSFVIPAPASGNAQKRASRNPRAQWAAEKRLRRLVYAQCLIAMRLCPRWERAVLHPGFALPRRLKLTRGAGPGTGVTRYDDDRFREGCAVVLDVLQVDRARRPGLGIIFTDGPKWLTAEFAQDASVEPGMLRIDVHECEVTP